MTAEECTAEVVGLLLQVREWAANWADVAAVGWSAPALTVGSGWMPTWISCGSRLRRLNYLEDEAWVGELG